MTGPDTGPAIQRAVTLRDLGRPAEALKLVRGALAQQPQDYQAQFLNARLLLDLGRTAEALRAAQTAAGFFPSDAALLALLARVQRESGAHRKAEQTARQVLALEPDHLAARLELGLALFEQANGGSAAGRAGLLPQVHSVADDLLREALTCRWAIPCTP
ncbi:tetratricopeptide repeat protein [Deinococcus lacus]|uniref:Tetratricopeptide repeat protein n=1 Tax=Deinococcus lacus TaxID=392561 RepID=A0ABW1YEC4_9DEIO